MPGTGSTQKSNSNSWPITYFLQNLPKNQDKMENIDKQLKISIHSILNPLSEDTITGIIQAIKYAGLESLLDLEFVQEEDLILVLKPIQRRKLIKAWSEQIISPVKKKSKKAKKSKPKKPRQPKFNKRVLLLQIYSKYKAELSCPDIEQQSVWKKISEEHRAQAFSDWDAMACCNTIKEFRLEYERCKNNTSTKWTQAMVIFKLAEEAFETIHNQDEKEQTIKKEKVESLSRIVSSTPPVSTFSTTTTVPVADSTNTVTTILSRDCDGGKGQRDFENNDFPLHICEDWKSPKYHILLQMYAKYKIGLSCPGVEKQRVWKKIANDNRIKHSLKLDEWQCYYRIQHLRCKYESIKNEYVTSREMAIFLDEAKNAFETTENAVGFSAAQTDNMTFKNCKKRKNVKDYHLKLLKLFIKYKADIASSDIDEQQVWEKIAQEMREEFAYSCGQYLCRFDLFQLKCEYESLKTRNVKSKDMIYFFEDAQKAFETIPNLDVSNSEVEVKKIGKYIPPHLRNAKNKQVETLASKTIERAFILKVKNVTKKAKESDLEELFKPFGTIHRIYMHQDKSGQCYRGFAFIRFERQDDAVRAFFTVDGHKYADLTLTVEWSNLSQIAKDFE